MSEQNRHNNWLQTICRKCPKKCYECRFLLSRSGQESRLAIQEKLEKAINEVLATCRRHIEMEIQTHQSAELNASVVLERVWGAYQLPRDVRISEWAIEKRILPKGTTLRPGPCSPEKCQIEIMGVILQPGLSEVVIQKVNLGQVATWNLPINYSLNHIPKSLSCRLLLGGSHLRAHERIQIEKNTDREEDAAEAGKHDERNWAMTQEAQTLSEQTENQDDSGEL